PTAPHDGLDARGELFQAEWLDDVIVGSELEAAEDLRLLAARRQHDDRNLRNVADAAAHLEAVESGQANVENNEVRQVGPHALERLKAVGGPDNVVPFAPE